MRSMLYKASEWQEMDSLLMGIHTVCGIQRSKESGQHSLFSHFNHNLCVTFFHLPPCHTHGSSHYAFSFTIPISHLSFPHIIYTFLPCDSLFLDYPKVGTSKLFQNFGVYIPVQSDMCHMIGTFKENSNLTKTKGLLRQKISVSICIASLTKPSVTKATYQESGSFLQCQLCVV